MIENTLENKMKFFALYWGQRVLINEGDQELVNKVFIAFMPWDSYLELTPLSQIRDEDAEYCIGKIECSMRKNDPNCADYGMSPSAIFINSLKGHNSFYVCRNEADYLRSKGYALKWIDLPVEMQIEYGWVKLKRESNV